MDSSIGFLDGYEHAPFPDVSGLRSNAPGRERAIECQVTLKETLESLDETEASFRWEKGTLLTAAWAVLLVSPGSDWSSGRCEELTRCLGPLILPEPLPASGAYGHSLLGSSEGSRGFNDHSMRRENPCFRRSRLLPGYQWTA